MQREQLEELPEPDGGVRQWAGGRESALPDADSHGDRYAQGHGHRNGEPEPYGHSYLYAEADRYGNGHIDAAGGHAAWRWWWRGWVPVRPALLWVHSCRYAVPAIADHRGRHADACAQE